MGLKEWVEETGTRYKSSMKGVEIIFDTPDKALKKLEQSANSHSLEPEEKERIQRLGRLVDSGDALPSTIPLAKRRKSACNSSEVPSTSSPSSSDPTVDESGKEKRSEELSPEEEEVNSPTRAPEEEMANSPTRAPEEEEVNSPTRAPEEEVANWVPPVVPE